MHSTCVWLQPQLEAGASPFDGSWLGDQSWIVGVSSLLGRKALAAEGAIQWLEGYLGGRSEMGVGVLISLTSGLDPSLLSVLST